MLHPSLVVIFVVVLRVGSSFGYCLEGSKCCGELTDPPHGHVSWCKADQFCPVGTLIGYSCDFPYQLKGPSLLVCQENGLLVPKAHEARMLSGPSYSELPPRCIFPINYCDYLPQYEEHLWPLACTTTYCLRSTIVVVYCKTGYTPVLTTVSCVQGKFGSQWSDAPLCKPTS